MAKYYKTPKEAEKANQKEYYRSSITHNGRIGGNDCPPDYRGDGRGFVQRIPETQKKD
jgi:hypothetical protein